jgi:glutaredoxin
MLRRQVIIYSRPGCHLCDEAKTAIQNAGCSDRFTLEEVNIESDKKLLRKYKYDIPVVMIDGVEFCRHRVDPEKFKRTILDEVSTVTR